jgi:hypothetical protein
VVDPPVTAQRQPPDLAAAGGQLDRGGGVQVVVADVAAAREKLLAHGHDEQIGGDARPVGRQRWLRSVIAKVLTVTLDRRLGGLLIDRVHQWGSC